MADEKEIIVRKILSSRIFDGVCSAFLLSFFKIPLLILQIKKYQVEWEDNEITWAERHQFIDYGENGEILQMNSALVEFENKEKEKKKETEELLDSLFDDDDLDPLMNDDVC